MQQIGRHQSALASIKPNLNLRSLVSTAVLALRHLDALKAGIAALFRETVATNPNDLQLMPLLPLVRTIRAGMGIQGKD